MKQFQTKDKATIWVSFANLPERIEVFRNKSLYFFRDLAGKHKSIKFNVAHPGIYTINVDCSNIAVLPLSIHQLEYELPPIERNREKPVKWVKNLSLKGTPARNFTHTGVIELGEKFYQLPFPIQEFIKRHEYAHFFYETEKYCDLWAAKKYIADGYNNSTAYYSLVDVLGSSIVNDERINTLFKNLNFQR